MFCLPKVWPTELVGAGQNRLARVRVDDIPVEGAAAGNLVRMPPEVAQLGPFAGDNEDRRSRAKFRPPHSRRSLAVCQTKVAQCGFQAFTVDPSLAKSDLIDAGVTIGSNAVSNAVDDEDANTRNGQKA